MWHLRGDPDRGRAASGRARPRPRPDERRDGPSRPERPRHARVARGIDRRAAPQHHRRRGWPPAVLERGRDDLGGPERRALQPRLAPRGPRAAAGTRFASRCDTEILPHLYEEYGPMFPTQLRGMFGVAIWDQVRTTRRDRARPARDQADLLRRLRRRARLRVRAQEPARERARAQRPRLRGDRRVPLARLLPRAGDAAGGGEEARARLPARDRGRQARAAALLELSAARRSSAAAASRSGASACSRSSRSRCGCG